MTDPFLSPVPAPTASAPVEPASTEGTPPLRPRPLMGAARLAGHLATQAQLGVCVQHPDTPAVRRCDRCQARMCATCDFAFDRLHVCPACIANPIQPISAHRLTLAIAGLVAVGFATAVLGVIMSGLWQLDESGAGVVFTVLIMLPSLLGTVLSCSAMDKRLGNHPLLWISMVWNLAMILLLMVFVIIGNMKG